MKLWYAIHTKPRQEDHAAEQLRRQEFEISLPKIKQARRFRQHHQFYRNGTGIKCAPAAGDNIR